MAQIGSPVSNQNGNSSSLVVSKTGVTAGSKLFFLWSYGIGAGSAPSLADSSGQTWTKDKSTGANGPFNTGVDLYRLDGANAGTHTITMTMPAGSFSVGTIFEWSGLATGGPDGLAGQSVGTTNVTTGGSGTSGVPAGPTDLAIAGICVNPPGSTSNDGLTTPSGWTVQELYTDTTVAIGANHITKDVSGTGTQSVTWTWTEASNFAGIIALYKYATSGTTVSCTLATVTDAGQSATVQLATAVNGAVGAVTDAGPAATVQLATAVNCTLGTVADAGLSASIYPGIGVLCALGTVTDAGLSANPASTLNIACALGTVTDAGQAALVQPGTSVNCTVGAATGDSLPATVTLPTNVACALGSVSDAGQSALIQTGISINCTIGAVVAAGLSAAVVLATTFACAIGTVTDAGQAANVQLVTNVSSSLGTVMDAGQPALIQPGTSVNCALGTVTAAGLASVVQTGTPPSIVSVTANKQTWQSGVTWSAKNVNVPLPGDAIITLGLFYVTGTLGQKYPPTDNAGTFTQGVDTGKPDPGSYPGYPQPVMSCIYYQLNAPTGTHTITPPNIGPPDTDDGNMWSVVVRGLALTGTPRATGHYHNVSNSAATTFPSVTVALSSPCQIGDVLMAIAGYDDDRTFGTVTFTDPAAPTGWVPISASGVTVVDTDAATSCPSKGYWKIATAADLESVTLAWNDPHATVVDASILAFAPLPAGVNVNCNTGTLSDAGQSATVQLTTAVNCALGTVADVGQAANVQLATNVFSTLATVADAGQASAVQIGTNVNCALATATDTGLSANVVGSTTVQAGITAIVSIGLPAIVQPTTRVNAEFGVMVTTGLPATVQLISNVACALGTVSGSGLLATISGTGATLQASPSHTYRGLPRLRIYQGLAE